MNFGFRVKALGFSFFCLRVSTFLDFGVKALGFWPFRA